MAENKKIQLLTSEDGKKKFEIRVKKGVREIRYDGDTFWQQCQEGCE